MAKKDKSTKKGRRAPSAEVGEPVPAPAEAAAPPPAPVVTAALPPLTPGQAGSGGRAAGLGLSRLVNTLGGAGLCYGEPIEVGDRIVVPITRVRGAGGYGFGRGSSGEDGSGDGDGGGGGGAIEASPAGFLDITPDGVRYEGIPDPITTARAISTAASGLAMLVGAAAGLRQLSRRRRGLLPPG